MGVNDWINLGIEKVEGGFVKLADVADGYDVIHTDVADEIDGESSAIYYQNEDWIQAEVLAYFNIRKYNF
jgi:hypothetical protein